MLLALNSYFKDLEKHGYCVSLGTYERTINGVGVPLVAGNSVYAMNCSGPAFQLPEARLREEVAPRLLHAARNIVAELLHHPSVT